MQQFVGEKLTVIFFSRLNFLMYIYYIKFGAWSCVISMNRWCLWSGIGVKNNSMSIFYVALSTCSVVLPICHVVLSTWSVVLLICRVILSHYRMAPIDLRCLHKLRPKVLIEFLSERTCWFSMSSGLKNISVVENILALMQWKAVAKAINKK